MAKGSHDAAFPLHWHVWDNDVDGLTKYLAQIKSSKCLERLEQKDPRGRTALMLAVVLGRTKCCKLLLENDADANFQTKEGWSVVNEATSFGDPELLRLIQQYRDVQRFSKRATAVSDLLKKLNESPDFYVEMTWELSSWIPLVSRFCPTDTYKVYKSGADVRIDTTLLGFDNMKWQRGSRSYVFKGQADSATFMEINHDDRTVHQEEIQVLPSVDDPLSCLLPSEDEVSARLTSPIVTSYLDIDNIEFERTKSGILGWRSNRTEVVNGYEAKVFSASNVRFLTLTRWEHLTEDDKKRARRHMLQNSSSSSSTSLEALLKIGSPEKECAGDAAPTRDRISLSDDQNIKSEEKCDDVSGAAAQRICDVTGEEYFNAAVDLGKRDIGKRKREVTRKTESFKATLWLCDKSYPLSLQEQVLPIIDLMAATNAHFAKLRDFITLQLPSGFPVKIEIPLYHVLNARITFGNIFASDMSVEKVSCLRGEQLAGATESGESKMTCVLDESVFMPPPGYAVIGIGRHRHQEAEDEDRMLQLAIEQSLIESGTETDQVTVWEALGNERPASGNDIPRDMGPAISMAPSEIELQKAIEASMLTYAANKSANPEPQEESNRPDSVEELTSNNDDGGDEVVEEQIIQGNEDIFDDQLRAAMEMSHRQQLDDDRRRKEEEEQLQQILALSLTEK